MQAESAPAIGIFGGTFDPIHFAHLRVAEEARELLGLERLLLVPAADPPHKRGKTITPAAHRVAMVRLAVRGNEGFQVSKIEVGRQGRSYTIDTLRQLRQRHPRNRLVLLMGLDAFREIDTWKDYRAIFAAADIAVVTRPTVPLEPPRQMLPVAVRSDFRYSPQRNVALCRNGNRVSFLSVTALDIAATDIRERVRAGRSIRYLLPPAVERYIEREGLYRAGRSRS